MAQNLIQRFGIDFGTTNSATVGFSILGSESSRNQYGDDEGRPNPSVVAIDRRTGNVMTGREAWNKKVELSDSCEYVSSVKSILATGWKKKIAGKTWSAVDIAAEIFKGLKRKVRETSGQNLEEAVVAIPVGFSAEKREEVRKAALQAGIDVTGFISEPTAAFYANYSELQACTNVAVFDWGGGTLDVSVLKNENGKLYELATAGINVAGDAIDDKLARRIHARLARKKNIKKAFEDMPHSAQDLLLVRSEKAKRTLSDSDDVTISMVAYGDFGPCRETIDYEWFSEVITPEVDMAINCLAKVIEESGVGLANIDRIVMVGGSSNLRPLIERMQEIYGDALYFPEETMWNVSVGAAMLALHPGAYHSNQSIGLVMSDGSYFELLPVGADLTEWERKCSFGLTDTSQEARFVFDGSTDIRESPLKYRSLNIPAYKFLQEKIRLTATVDEDLIFRVNAGSNMRPDSFGRIWEYPNLKCYYELRP